MGNLCPAVQIGIVQMEILNKGGGLESRASTLMTCLHGASLFYNVLVSNITFSLLISTLFYEMDEYASALTSSCIMSEPLSKYSVFFLATTVEM
jgi:hypothetical protein